jgi:CubicO group peptidase (beta-lactamase class C family)
MTLVDTRVRARTRARGWCRGMPAGVLAMAVLATAVLTGPAAAQADPLAGLDAYIERAMADWQVPGLAIAVVRNDSVIYARGFGVREAGGTQRVDEHTLFAIASTTKAMTAAVLGTLVDEKRIAWDDRVQQHLPGFQLSDPYITQSLTIRDLLTHRSGISRSDNLWIAGPFDRGEVLRRARYLPATSGFRSEYGYHNVMYIAAGELAAAVSGRSWDELMRERLFAPLRMTRSTTRSAEVDARDNVATSHTVTSGRVTPMARRNYDNIGGAGAAFSSVHDMAQWLRMHLNGGVYDGRRILTETVLKELHTPQMVIRADTAAERLFPGTHLRAYGLGWTVQDYHGRKLVQHSGSINFTRTQIGMVPGERIGVVAITNLSSSNLQAALMYRVLDALMGLPQRDWSAELLEVQRRGEARSAETSAETERGRRADTRPSLGLESYTGTYTNELYGDARVTLEEGRLVVHYAPEYIADLTHWHFDTFRGSWRQRGFGTAFVTFALDRRARVATMELEGFGVFRRSAAR